MKRRTFLVIADLLILSTAFFLSAHWFHVNPKLLLVSYGLILVTKIFLFVRFGLYHAILRFAGLPLAATILKATTLASIISFLVIHFSTVQSVPSEFFVADYLIATFLIGILRFTPRYLTESLRRNGFKRILILGAGDLGEEVSRKLLRNPEEYRLIGFLDDNPSKIGKKLHNLPIYGPASRLSRILASHRISELIIAISNLPGEVVRNITRECRQSGVFCRIVPSFSEMLKSDVDIKNLDISDLLKRKPKDLDEAQIRRFIRDKVILITGAGGSIGSELTRQCVTYGAKKIIAVDHSEFNLYNLQEELGSRKVPVRFLLTNILNGQFESIFGDEKPDILFHAAAYKHVPIVEDNPCDGIINNVLGTIRAAQLAEKYSVGKFVLISTDKAVRPTSVMGASKRIGEIYVHNLDARSKTEFVAVRFGNVLGSSGSVIPKFIEQINRGGPLTVTHPDVTRYFMLTSEAVQLVLQAAGIGNGGEIFILNMGLPIRIAEMAEDLIFLSGREPHRDIKIEFTGLRPGEKLYEELIVDETEKKTRYENITIARTAFATWERLLGQVETLLALAEKRDRTGVLRTIKTIVPEFMHNDLGAEFLKQTVIPLRRSV